jgi:hypothetical protein
MKTRKHLRKSNGTKLYPRLCEIVHQVASPNPYHQSYQKSGSAPNIQKDLNK